MEMLPGSYYFKGNNEEIINSILSVLLGKETYGEASVYSHFINESLPLSYREKMRGILDFMQKEKLILIREHTQGGIIQLVNSGATDKSIFDFTPDTAQVHLRQHGKKVLSEGGVKKSR